MKPLLPVANDLRKLLDQVVLTEEEKKGEKGSALLAKKNQLEHLGVIVFTKIVGSGKPLGVKCYDSCLAW